MLAEVTIVELLFVMEWFISKFLNIKSLVSFYYFIYFSDLLQNPLIVPLKRLDYHDKKSDFGIFEVLFHPTQP